MNKKKKFKENLLGYGFLVTSPDIAIYFPNHSGRRWASTMLSDYMPAPDERKFIDLIIPSVQPRTKLLLRVSPFGYPCSTGSSPRALLSIRSVRAFWCGFAPVVMSLVVISILWLYLLNPNNGLEMPLGKLAQVQNHS